ncbi:solute carrier family 25 member 32 isoform X2 [Macaca fascicularis]|uniref:solute carrier family 25 member 32 isoform X2 n=1 Tax=Macaca fascicularis TaxID=9541 RepID=UPI003D15D42A
MTGQGHSASGSSAWSTVFRHVRYENLVAGVSGGVLSNLALHPLDLVKIRFAVSDGLELRPKYNGILHCLTTIWKLDGLRGLYQGVTPNVWGAGLSWGLYFFFQMSSPFKITAVTCLLKKPWKVPMAGTFSLFSEQERCHKASSHCIAGTCAALSMPLIRETETVNKEAFLCFNRFHC